MIRGKIRSGWKDVAACSTIWRFATSGALATRFELERNGPVGNESINRCDSTRCPARAEAATILLVDDDSAIRELMRHALADQGYRLLEAADSIGARELMAAGPPNLIISDIFMPGGDGFELLNWMRATRRMTPIIVISGSARHLEIDFLEAASKPGAVGVLQKPFLRSSLLELVQRALT